MREPIARRGEKTTTVTAHTVRLAACPQTRSQNAVLIPLRSLRELRSISTATLPLLPNPNSHNTWIKNGGIPVYCHLQQSCSTVMPAALRSVYDFSLHVRPHVDRCIRPGTQTGGRQADPGNTTATYLAFAFCPQKKLPFEAIFERELCPQSAETSDSTYSCPCRHRFHCRWKLRQ